MPTEEAKKAMKIIRLLEANKETDLLVFFLKMIDKIDELTDEDFVPSNIKDIDIKDDVPEGPYKVHIDSKGFQSII